MLARGASEHPRLPDLTSTATVEKRRVAFGDAVNIT
jgi:hypothetical protein